MSALNNARYKTMFKELNLKRKYKSYKGAIIEENVAALYLLFIFLFFPMLDLASMGLRAFFLWFACEQAAMAGSKGTIWSTNNYANNYYTSIQTQTTSTANSVVNIFTGIQVTSGPTLTVIAQAIPNSGATTTVWTPSTSTFLDKSLYIPILQVSMTGTVQPFIIIPFIPNVPGLNTPFTMTVCSQQQIENPTALSY
jgi:hypothetical protein